VNQLQQERDDILNELRTNLCKVQNHNRVQANNHHRDVEY